jgi:hypothetical protein
MTIDRLAPVTLLRPRVTAAAGYGDTDAMNDIHALLTGAAGLADRDVAEAVAEIVSRTGRSLARARAITAEVTDDGHGMPVAQVDADGTVVLIGQNPDGHGVLVLITTRDAAERDVLVIAVDGTAIDRSPAALPLHRNERRQSGRLGREEGPS